MWHPGGAHPFIGLNEALVHNGDFANYHSVSRVPGRAQHLPAVPHRHRGLGPAVRPAGTACTATRSSTSSRPWRRRRSWTSTACRPRSSGSTARSRPPTSTPRPTARGSSSSPAAWPRRSEFQLLGITDTAMLRPQVFALQEGEVSIGLICSEKQAIDATLASLASEDPRFTPVADHYWNARGGSYTDGGAFLLTVSPMAGAKGNGSQRQRRTTTCASPTSSATRSRTPPGQVALRSLGPAAVAGRRRRRPGGASSRRSRDDDAAGLFAVPARAAARRWTTTGSAGSSTRSPRGRPKRRRPWASRP